MKNLLIKVMTMGVLLITAVFLVACDNNNPPPQPSANPITTPEATPTTKIVTREPTPTTAVCTPLPDDMTLDVQFESNLHGVIVVTGLQPSDRPIIILTGEAPTESWRYEFELANAVGDNGRFQDKFDFSSWPSVDGYTFKGQIIYQRGVACFDIDLPENETARLIDPTPPLNSTEATAQNPVETAVATQTSETEAIITRLQTLQTQYEQMVDGYEGWVYRRHTEYFPTALRGSQEAINFLWLADTWVWESWREITDGNVNRQISHTSDEDGGIWQRQLIADGWTAFVLPVETLEGRVQPYDYLPVNVNALGGTSWLITMLQERRNPHVTAWEADNLYHVVIEEIQEAPTEMIGLPAPVTTVRYQYLFDSETGLLQQQSSEALLSTGEWQSTGNVTYDQFELLPELPPSAAATLAEGTTLLAQP